MSIHSILIGGGTHGNELSGVYAIKHWLQDSHDIRSTVPSANIELLLVNEAAVNARTRFIDEDFNRQFDLAKLAANEQAMQQANQQTVPLSHEAALAQQLNQRYGPKSSPQVDFIIDIHNTTSAMGPTLIVLEHDTFNRNLARYVKTHMPNANILVEDHIPYQQQPYFCTLGKRSVMVEVGPQAQGALRAQIYQQTVEMTQLILTYIEAVNANTYFDFAPVEAFRLLTEVPYPTDDNGNRSAMIHPMLDGNDFQVLLPQSPCFIDFSGKDIVWQGDPVYPHFIGEAAYDKQNLAFATANKCQF
jgi:aspartoacylase